jgi:hypothetical protein
MSEVCCVDGCCIDKSTRLHAYTPTRLHAYTPTRLHTYTPTRLHTYTPTRLHACTLARPTAYAQHKHTQHNSPTPLLKNVSQLKKQRRPHLIPHQIILPSRPPSTDAPIALHPPSRPQRPSPQDKRRVSGTTKAPSEVAYAGGDEAKAACETKAMFETACAGDKAQDFGPKARGRGRDCMEGSVD